MVVQPEGKVVRDQVLAADTNVKRIKVLEISPHALEGLLGDARLRNELIRQLCPTEDIVPDFINHLLSFDASLAPTMGERLSTN